MNELDLLQPLAALMAYLRSEGLTAETIREIIDVHAVEYVHPDSQRAFVEGVLER